MYSFGHVSFSVVPTNTEATRLIPTGPTITMLRCTLISFRYVAFKKVSASRRSNIARRSIQKRCSSEYRYKSIDQCPGNFDQTLSHQVQSISCDVRIQMQEPNKVFYFCPSLKVQLRDLREHLDSDNIGFDFLCLNRFILG